MPPPPHIDPIQIEDQVEVHPDEQEIITETKTEQREEQKSSHSKEDEPNSLEERSSLSADIDK